MTPIDRAANYAATFRKFPPLRADERWLDGSWVFGNNYKGSGLYGSYPPAFLKRVDALFPDMRGTSVLHLFGGSLTANEAIKGIRIDLVPTRTVSRMATKKDRATGVITKALTSLTMTPDIAGDAHALPFRDASFDFVVADPPYSKEDAKRYGTKMVDRKKVMHEAARVTKPGGHLVWLDTSLPMFKKTEWHWWGAIGIWRSTNHRVRGVMMFERQ